MGLDMYLSGRKLVLWSRNGRPKEDGYDVSERVLELGYWRKHPNLHGYIVENFADGVDDCRPVYLDETQLTQLIEAVKTRKLPHTDGFFFGESDTTNEQVETDLNILGSALDWLRTPDEHHLRGVLYQASW